MDVQTIPDYVQPLVGYRAWLFNDETARLHSFNGTPWPLTQPLEAQCPNTDAGAKLLNYPMSAAFMPWRITLRGDPGKMPSDAHMIADQDCTCGIYAYNERDVGALFFVDSMILLVVGTVYLWGKVAKHRWGYRAQYAFPKELYCFYGYTQLASYSNCQVHSMDDLCCMSAPELVQRCFVDRKRQYFDGLSRGIWLSNGRFIRVGV